MNFGMREALRLWLKKVSIRPGHAIAAMRRCSGVVLKASVFQCMCQPTADLPTLTTVRIPEGVDGKAFSQHLLNNHGIEVGGGLGSLAGKIWRIGLMGYNSTPENVNRLLNLFETELPRFSGSCRRRCLNQRSSCSLASGSRTP
jgi:alanine-glyoxylate transaminase/serine-glyoxylate transaminase/serine-pyruvate transaminase